MDLYLVGGALRNLLLRKEARDRDYVWFGRDAELLALFPDAKQVGKAFPVYLHAGKEYAQGRGENIHADLAARDLTINAMALCVSCDDDARQDEQLAGRLVMHPQAAHDLKHGWLRPAAPDSFLQDPLRVFRLARFAAELPDFRLSLHAVAAMREVRSKGKLHDLDAERVGAELLKALAAPLPGRFLEVLDRGDCLAPWFSPLDCGAIIPAGPPAYHGANSVLWHTIHVMNDIAAQGGDSYAVWMGLCHDLGKCISPTLKLPRHHGHEKYGLPLARALAERLRLSARHRKIGEAACLQHMKVGGYDKLRAGTKVDVLAALHASRVLEPMLALAQADRAQVGLGESYAPIRARVKRDMQAMLAVRLPKALRNLGAESGKRLREMRCNAISRGECPPTTPPAPPHGEKDSSQAS